MGRSYSRVNLITRLIITGIIISFTLIFGIMTYFTLENQLSEMENPEFYNKWGGNNADRGYDVQTDSEGNIITMGCTDSFGNGKTDIFFVKYSKNGEILWNRTWGTSYSDNAWDMVIDPNDNIYTTGSIANGSTDELFVVKLNSDGLEIYNHTIRHSNPIIGYSIDVDSQGRVYVLGFHNFTSYNGKPILFKFDSNGNQLWNSTINISTGYYYPAGRVQLISDSKGYISFPKFYGIAVCQFDNNGAIDWTEEHDMGGRVYDFKVYDMLIDGEENIYLICESFSSSVLVKCSSEGKLLWNYSMTFELGALGLYEEGILYVIGTDYDYQDYNLYIEHFDLNGKSQGSREYNAGRNEYGRGICIDEEGNTYIIGYIENSDHTDAEMIFIKNLPLEINENIVLTPTIIIIGFICIGSSYYIFVSPYVIYGKEDKKRRIEEKLREPLPTELATHLTGGEELLYAKKIGQIGISDVDSKKLGKWIPIYMLIVFLVLGFFYWIGFLVEIIFTPYLGGLISLFILGSIAYSPFLTKLTSSRNTYLVITDKKIYQIYDLESEAVASIIKISELNSVVFNQSKSQRKMDAGSINFYPNYKLLNRSQFGFSQVADFSETRKEIESVLYSVFDVEIKWPPKEKLSQYRIPCRIETDLTAIKQKLKRLKYSIIAAGLGLIILIFLGIYVIMPLLSTFEMKWTGIVNLFVPMISVIMFLVYKIKGFLLWMKYVGVEKLELEVLEDKIILYENEQKKREISLNAEVALGFRIIMEAGANPMGGKYSIEWGYNTDGIVIKSAPYDKEPILFGPIKNFKECYECLTLFLLYRKKQKGIIYDLNEIEKKMLNSPGYAGLREKHTSLKPSERQTEDTPFHSTDEDLKIEIQGEEIESLPKSSFLYAKLSHQLDSDEKLFFSHNQEVPYKKYGIFIPIFLVSMIIIILEMLPIDQFFDNFESTYYLLILLLINLILLYVFPKRMITGYKKNNMWYYLTDKQLIVENLYEFIQIPYQNILKISKEEGKRNRYTILVNYHPKEENDGHGLRTVYGSWMQIERIPEENNFYIIFRRLYERSRCYKK